MTIRNPYANAFAPREPELHTLDMTPSVLTVRRHIQTVVVSGESAPDTLHDFIRLILRYGIQCAIVGHADRPDTPSR